MTTSAQPISSACLIDGDRIEFTDAPRIPVFDPATGQQITSVANVGADGVDRAVQAAKRAFPSWAATPPKDRGACLLRLAAAIEDRGAEFARLEALDVGKPIDGAVGEVASTVDKWRFFAGACRVMSATVSGEYRDNITSMIRREPLGVVAALAPWNYPMGMCSWKLGPALAAGNTVVFKPAPETPLTTLLLAELAAELLPPGVLNVITGDGASTGALMVAHPDVAMVSLTGDTGTGKVVMRAAADQVKRVHLELGGKAPAVIFDDADLERLAAAFPAAAFRNTGQDCHAACRVYAGPGVEDEVVSVISDVAESIVVGSQWDPGVFMGPLVSERHRDRVEGFTDRALASGHMEAVTGGGRLEKDGYFFAPTVIAGARQEDEIVQQEVFGPIVTVTPFKTEEDVVRLCNEVSYGLAASVWTSNIDRAVRMARALRFGTVWVNEHGKTIGEMPFGGYKESGIGRDLSMQALEDHTETKHIAIGVADLDDA